MSPTSPARRPNEVSAGGVLVRPAPGAPGAYEVALVRGGRYWGLPKGHLESGETAADAAIREVAEECGIPAERLRLGRALPGSDYVFRAKGRLVFKHVDFFLIEAPPEAVLVPQEDEIAEAEWLTFDEALNRASFGDTRTAIEAAREALDVSPS